MHRPLRPRRYAGGMSRHLRPKTPFYRFHSSPEIIRLVVMLYVRYPLPFRNVQALAAQASYSSWTP